MLPTTQIPRTDPSVERLIAQCTTPDPMDAIERGVLGSLLKNPEWAFDLRGLSRGHFTGGAHRRLYAHLAAAIRSRRPIDEVLLAARDGALVRELGGESWLVELKAAAPVDIALAKEYVDTLGQRRSELQVQSTAQAIQRIAAGKGRPGEKMARMASALSESQDRGPAEPIKMETAISDLVGWLVLMEQRTDPITGLRTGFVDLDNKTSGLQPGELVIVAGRPAMGKTAFGLNIAENVALGGKHVLFFSLEMSQHQLVLRLMSSVGRIPLADMRSPINLPNHNEFCGLVGVAMEKLAPSHLNIIDNSAMRVPEMHAAATSYKRKHGQLDLIVIDYIQLMTGAGSNRQEEVSSISRGLKMMARDLGVPVIALSQLSRKADDRKDNRPALSDLRESGAIEQDADVVIMMYRDEYYNKDTLDKGLAEANIVKQRMGECCTILLTWRGEYCQFRDHAGNLPSFSSDRAAGKPSRGRK